MMQSPQSQTDGPGSQLESLKKASRWLSGFAENFHSQTGEDGIIAKALSLLPVRDRYAVEFGAWDGRHLSNTYSLVERDNFSVVLIEGDKEKYCRLCSDYPFKDRATFVHQFVGWSDQDGLDAILGKYPIPKDFDLLSIDVDGNDFHIWKATRAFRPKLVLIEYNPTASNRLDFVQPADAKCNQGSSPAALVRLGKEKGYELISITGVNLLFVDKKFYSLFGIPDNSLAVMRDEDQVTCLYFGFDGSLFADGPALLPWHGEKLHLGQPLPGILRRYPPTYNRLQMALFRLHRWLAKGR